MPALVPGGSHVVLACKADLVIRAVTSFLGERESREHFASISTSALTCVQEEWMAISKRAQTGAVGPHVIAPGPAKKARQDNDPAIESFLSLLAEDMVRFPEQIKPLDPVLVARIDALVGHLPVNPHEDLGGESLV